MIITSLLALCSMSLSPIQAKTFTVGGPNPAAQIFSVESQSDFEDFIGTTNQVSGKLTYDPKTKTGTANVSVKVGSIDTGIPLRNDHMKSAGWLDADKFPEATFVVTDTKAMGGDKYKVSGKLTLKGVTKSISGEAIVKIYLQPGANVPNAISQITSAAQAVIRGMPPGITPPLVIRYSASNVPIVQASLGSDTLSEQQIFDLTTNVLRPGMASVPGAQIPYPYGGKQRQVMVDIDPEKLYGFNLSPADISAALNNQNLILPSAPPRSARRNSTSA